MADTSPSLLDRLRTQPDQGAWRQFVDIYEPLLHSWLARHALQPHDADDLVQEVMAALVRELPQFHYDPKAGAFRGWLRTVLSHRLRAFWRKRQAHPAAGGDFLLRVDQLEDPKSELTQRWNEEHDRWVANRLLERIRPDFEAATWQAFSRVVLDGVSSRQAAAELGVSVNAVFIAKSRVFRRLRQEMRGLSDW